MSKSADAFRTISEVADWLGVQPHVLRFWESKFTQVKPVKRAGGRRYYRPNDMLLLGGIRKLLHEDGLTIKGVQKIIREDGMAYVADLSPSLDEELGVIEFETPPMPTAPEADPSQPDMFADVTPVQETVEEPVQPPVAPPSPPRIPPAAAAPAPETPSMARPVAGAAPEAQPEPPADPDEAPMMEDAPQESAQVTELPRFMHRQSAQADPAPAAPNQPDQTVAAAPQAPAPPSAEPAPAAEQAGAEPFSDLPSFLTDSPATPPEDSDNAPPAPPQPMPRVIDAPDPDESTFVTAPSTLTTAIRTAHLTPEQRREILPLIARLAAHRDQLASGSAQTGQP